jgi:hypothetical protein
MQIVESIELKHYNSDGNLAKITGTLFCKECGSQYNVNTFDTSNCPICKGHEFLSGDIADLLLKYIRLDKEGILKKYYKERYGRDSVIKMNSKRIMMWMLIREGLMKVDDNSMEIVINRILWKRF